MEADAEYGGKQLRYLQESAIRKEGFQRKDNTSAYLHGGYHHTGDNSLQVHLLPENGGISQG